MAGIEKLAPAFAEVKQGKVLRRWRHYDLPTGQVTPFREQEEAVETVQEALKVAVRRQLIADASGAFLLEG